MITTNNCGYSSRMAAAVFVALMCGIIGLLGVAGSASVVDTSNHDSINFKTCKPIVYYLREIVGGPNRTVVPIAGPGSDLVTFGPGLFVAFNNFLMASSSPSAPVIGSAKGFGVVTSQPPESHISSTHTFNSGSLGVGSIEIAGNNDASKPASELTVSGGTGAFRFCTGVVTISLVSSIPPTNIYKLVVNFV